MAFGYKRKSDGGGSNGAETAGEGVGTSALIGASGTSGGSAEDKRYLKALKRQELLEIMLRQQKQIDELKAQLAKANAELEKRQIRFAYTGNLADAVLEINGVLKAAQQAADDYVRNVMAKADAAYERSIANKQKGGGNAQ